MRQVPLSCQDARFRVTGWKARLGVLWRVLRGRDFIDVWAYEAHVLEVDEHNHSQHLLHIAEIDRMHNWLGPWAHAGPLKPLKTLLEEIAEIEAGWNTVGTPYPWDKE